MKINNNLSKAQYLYKQEVVLFYSKKILLGSFRKTIENKKKYKTSKNLLMFISFYLKHSGKRLNQC